MKKREIKNGKKTEVILSEATDGVNRVRLIGSARAEEEECPWEEIDAYSGRFIVAGLSYDGTSGTDGTNNNHPWIAYSTDGGETWTKSVTTAEESQPHGWLYALTYGGGRFVVAGLSYDDTGDTDGTNNYHPWIAYSTDGGKTWTKSVTTAEETQPHGLLQALTYGGGRFVVAGYSYDTGGTDNYHPWIAYSTDGGETWTKSVTTAEESQPHGLLRALTYGGGRFVVAGYSYDGTDGTDNYHPWIAYSTDGGKTWTKSVTTAEGGQPHGYLYALTYGGGRFVVAGCSYDTGGTDNYHPWIAYSTDGGETWTRSKTTAEETQPHGLLQALTYAPDSYCWKFGTENEETEE